ncbi:MAG TPA: hypothetical protein VFX30_09960 [bacterium]|nr:hypothetical protein [bacterium]
MKTAIMTIITLAALLAGSSAGAEGFRLKGPHREVESGCILFNLGRPTGETCEEKVEAQKEMIVLLQNQIECLKGEGSSDWNTQTTEDGDSPVSWDGGDYDGDGVTNKPDADSDGDAVTAAVLKKVEQPQIKNPGAVQAAICEAYSDLLQKQIKSLKDKIEELKK